MYQSMELVSTRERATCKDEVSNEREREGGGVMRGLAMRGCIIRESAHDDVCQHQGRGYYLQGGYDERDG